MDDANSTQTGPSADALVRGVLDSSPDGIVAMGAVRVGGTIVDFEFHVVNPAAERIVDCSADQLIGRRLSEQMPGVMHDNLFDRYVDVVESGREYSVDMHDTYEPTGCDRWLRVTAVRLQDGVAVTFRDISHGHGVSDGFEQRSMHDNLTGLPNRALLGDRLRHAVRSSTRLPAAPAVFVVDVDRFTEINENFGYEAGDEVLVEVAKRLRLIARSGDTVARMGSDEFVVVAGGLNDDAALWSLADRLCRACEFAFEFDGRTIFCTVSVGGTIAGGDDEPMNAVRDAHAAMHRAKAAGRNRTELFDDSLRAEFVHRVEVERGLRRAIELDELEVFYQPVVSPRDGSVISAEALIRWRHHGVLRPPAHFLGVAESSGLIIPIGEFVLRSAIALMQRLDEHYGLGFLPSVSVNFAAAQLSTPGMADMVAGVLDEFRIAYARLCVEVTETSLIGDPVTAASTLRTLSDLGVEIALDDFGTGYSPLTYLQRFPVDVIKVDRSFTMRLGETPADDSVVDAVIAMTRRLGKHVVAEGVETRRQLEILTRLDVDAIQGYLFSPPVASDELPALILDHGYAAQLADASA